MNKIASELVKIAKELTASEIDYRKVNRIKDLLSACSLVRGEEKKLSAEDISKANRALEIALSFVKEYGEICLKGKETAGMFKSETEKLKKMLSES